MLYQLSKLGGVSRALPAADTASRASGSGRQMARRFVAEARCQAPQQEIYRPAVRGCPVAIHRQKKAPTFRSRLSCLRYLFSRPVPRQLSSAYMCLTSVFGMGTGGPTRQSTQTHYWKRFSPSYIQPIYVDFCY